MSYRHQIGKTGYLWQESAELGLTSLEVLPRFSPEGTEAISIQIQGAYGRSFGNTLPYLRSDCNDSRVLQFILEWGIDSVQCQ